MCIILTSFPISGQLLNLGTITHGVSTITVQNSFRIVNLGLIQMTCPTCYLLFQVGCYLENNGSIVMQNGAGTGIRFDGVYTGCGTISGELDAQNYA